MTNRKIKLYYHTGTGNSLKIARDIGSKLGGHELISIAKLLKGNAVIEGDLVGFIFPIYFARPPVILQEFIENAEFGDTKYVFAVANGGGLFGKALKILENIFRVRGVTLNAGFIIYDKFLGQNMNDFPIHRNCHCPGSVNYSVHIIFRNFRALDGHDAAAVESSDVSAGNTGAHR